MHRRIKLSPTRNTVAALLALCLPACMLETDPFEEDGELDVASQGEAIRCKISGGCDVNGKKGVVELIIPGVASAPDRFSCTGSMVGPDLILTAAHCFDDGVPPTLFVRYFEPGRNASSPRDLGWVKYTPIIHSGYSASTEGQRAANRDIALVQLTGTDAGGVITAASRWPGTDYHDYLDIYAGSEAQLLGAGYLHLFGRGNNWIDYAHGAGTLRSTRFVLEDLLDYRLHLDQTDGKGTCKGDSGGPWLVPDPVEEFIALDLIACVHSRAIHAASKVEGEEYCGQGTTVGNDDAKCTRTVPDNTDRLFSAAGRACRDLNDGTYRYKRCFDVPFINDMAGDGYDQDDAVALTVAAVL